MTFPISKAKAAGIVSLTDNATIAQRNSEAQPRIVTHHHPSAKHPFAAPSCFGSSNPPQNPPTPLVVPDDASRNQSEYRYPGYPINPSTHDVQSVALKLSAHSYAESMETLKHVVPPCRLPAVSHPAFAPAGPDDA
ncbi:hypothetical protein CaCOL14_012760 [Colletotrichum acutatum]